MDWCSTSEQLNRLYIYTVNIEMVFRNLNDIEI